MALSVRYRIWLPPWCLADEGAQQRVAAWLDRKGLAACGSAKLCAVGRGLQHAVLKSWLAVHSDELDNNTALNIQVLLHEQGVPAPWYSTHTVTNVRIILANRVNASLAPCHMGTYALLASAMAALQDAPPRPRSHTSIGSERIRLAIQDIAKHHQKMQPRAAHITKPLHRPTSTDRQWTQTGATARSACAPSSDMHHAWLSCTKGLSCAWAAVAHAPLHPGRQAWQQPHTGPTAGMQTAHPPQSAETPPG